VESRARIPLLLLAIALALALAGCGLGAGKAKPGPVELRVTRDFGTRQLGTPERLAKVRDSDTVMRLLTRKHKVTTRYGGGFVESIDGLAGKSSSQRVDWFYFVNGIEASTGAADRKLRPGDVVQWDRRDWRSSMHVPAIVGAYPEPFVHGENGKRFPVRVECAQPSSAPCEQVIEKLTAAGVVASPGEIGTSSGGQLLRVVVGRGSQIVNAVSAAALLERGPSQSGVFARFTGNGSKLELLAPDGSIVRSAPAGTGLVAATESAAESPTWIVSGVDDAGVSRAAAALDAAKLRNAYAVAAGPAGIQKLPLDAGGAK
jgi:hypothetical protein